MLIQNNGKIDKIVYTGTFVRLFGKNKNIHNNINGIIANKQAIGKKYSITLIKSIVDNLPIKKVANKPNNG